MASPYPTTALLGSLLYIMRHEPDARQHRDALLAALRRQMAGGLILEAGTESLQVDGIDVPLDAPGATLLSEQMRIHGVRQARLPPDVAEADLLRLSAVLAAFPGTYNSFGELVTALGPASENIAVSAGTDVLDVFRPMPWRPRARFDPEAAEEGGFETTELEREEGTVFDQLQAMAANPPAVENPAQPVGGSLSSATPGEGGAALDDLVREARDAIQREDFEGLLEAALQLVEAEAAAPTAFVASTYRIAIKRLLGRKQLAMIARLAHGPRKQEVISLLRRFGSDATEILMDLLVDAMSMGERRGYYSAITQMNEGTAAIIAHLGHYKWYVVRNAAELCGELELADAVPALSEHTAHADERVRKSVALALAKIATPSAVAPLRQLLSDQSTAVRLQAVGALSGRRAHHMVGIVGEFLRKETNSEVQTEGLLALGRMGSPDAVAVLKEWASPGGKLLGRRPMATRLTAVRALGLCGPDAAEVLSALQKDDSAEVRGAASAALASIQP
jgi:HEAT repeat protein